MKCFRSISLCSLVSLLPTIAGAGIIGVSFSGAVVSIDEATGTGVSLGVSGFPGLNSLAKDSSGVLFSVGPDLITIDPITGVGTLIATLDFGAVTPDVRGLAFSPGGVLLAVNNTGPAGGLNPDDLFTVDPSTGAGTLVGATGLTALQSVAFSASGALYGWDINIGLTTIDPLTGAATDVNPLVGATADIQGIAFSLGGTLFGARDALYTIDPVSGTTAFVGSGGYSDVRGIEVTSIPEPGAGTLVLLGIGLAIMFGRRRST